MSIAVAVALSAAQPAMALQPSVQPPAASADSVEAHARAVLAISEFFIGWQRLWRTSETRRAEMRWREDAMKIRLPYVHCHGNIPSGQRVMFRTGVSDVIGRPFTQFPLVESDNSHFAACPTWILGADIPQASDEAEWRDGALVPALRARAFDSRARLIDRLDSALASWPGSTLLTGHVVRFHVDQRDFDGAAKAARSCRGAEWWCLALSGYVMARRGLVVQADSIYATMRAAMSPPLRCEWQDVRAVLAPADTFAFGKAGCADRERAVGILWWLSDPLYRVRGNDRLVAHETRRVDVALHRALDSDERYPWDTPRGGDAMARLVERYGWPTYTAWGGLQTDFGHSQYLLGFRSVPVPPFTTLEYSLDRVRLMPSWTAAREPYTMRATDWNLAGETADGALDPNWWPYEHVFSARRLLQLPEGQTAMFRRQSHITLVTAHRLDHPLMLRDSARFDAMLLTTTGAEQIDSLDQRAVRGGETVVLQSTIAPGPQLVAVEAMGIAASRMDTRIRYGIVSPAPLNAMARGEIGISEPAVIDVRGDVANLQLPDESLLDHLLGTVVLGADQRRIGLYWETYGVAAGDTVTVTVSMASDQDIGSLRKLGMALNLASDPKRSLQIRWTEPNSQRNTRTLTGPVPVQLRSLVLNISQLSPGPYVLTVSIERAGSGVASGQRRVLVAP